MAPPSRSAATARRLLPLALAASACNLAAPRGADAAAAGTVVALPAAVAAPPRQETVFTLLAMAEVRGTPEPCGCQSDPLGDLARVAGLLAAAKRRGPALLVDAGGSLYSGEPLPTAERPQAEQKAKLLAATFRSLGVVAAVGDEDLRFGEGALAGGGRLLARRAQARPIAGLEPSLLQELGGLRVGVTAVIDPARAGCGGRCPQLLAEEPLVAARREVAALRQRGAEIVIVLAHLGRAESRRLAAAVPGITVIVAGEEVGDGAEAEQIGETILVQPAQQLQRVARIELHLAPERHGEPIATPLFDGPAGRARGLARIDQRAGEIQRLLDGLAKDAQADPGFVKTQRERLAELQRERARLAAAPLTPPAGAYATAELVPIRRALPRDPKIAAAMQALDAEVGELNRRAGERIAVPKPKRGQPGYAGVAECEGCHDDAIEQWQTTRHPHAFTTLVEVNKQWSFDCIKCHVTGYGEAGGSAIAHVAGKEAVQCEVCHGPASLHAAAPKRHRLRMPEERDCRGCHTRDHSDTFDFTAYLRDVLGPGHGARRRLALGDGPSGHQLRAAAKQRAAGH